MDPATFSVISAAVLMALIPLAQQSCARSFVVPSSPVLAHRRRGWHAL